MPKKIKQQCEPLNDDLQQEMFVEERVNGVLDNAGGLLLRWVINRHCAVWVTTASCNKNCQHQIRLYVAFNTKMVISEMFFPAKLDDEKLNLMQEMQKFTNETKKL